MGEDAKADPLEKNSHVVKRAVTWEISESEADSDVDSWKTTGAGSGHLPSASWDCAGKEKPVRVGSSSEGPSLGSASQEAPSARSPKTRRKKRSPEEMEASRAKLEARKLERELKKEERLRRQQQSALEKQKKKEAANAMKLLRPDQCMKRLTVCVDPGLLKDPGSDVLLEALGSLDCQSCLEPQAHPCSITWRRNLPSNASTGVAGRWSAPDLSHLLPSSGPGDRPAKVFTVVVVGLEAFQWYCRQHGETLDRGPEEQSGNRERSLPGPELYMTQRQTEEAQVLLQLWGNAGVLFLETWLDLAQHVLAMTKAIAQRPYKKYLGAQPFSFCSAGKWASGVRVCEDGAGLREAWCRQIQQFSRASPAVAEAVARAYPSPRLLLQAYEGLCSEMDRQLLLSDVRVEPEEGGKERRVGPDLSRRIYLFLASTNPELVLDWSA
ncbi:structure-specific endonuclease subunit EME2 isoform X2 [Paroedura picta]|uniref:structure-specific endonuclease subunit EME2 isoform X2 n=1 Tax=Paroedura picta TaxID=143630 RepID=UPI004057B0EE